jgi:hypothetical protein
VPENIETFFRTRVLLHTHAEKCAGTTLIGGLTKMFGATHDLRPGNNKRVHEMSPVEREGIRLLTGHFHYGTHGRFFARRPVYVATAREPLDRFGSYYRFVSARSDHPGFANVDGKTFDEVVNWYLDQTHNQATNYLLRFFSGATAPDDITVHVENRYAIIAPHNRVNELVAGIADVFGLPAPQPAHLNRGDDKPSDLRAETVDRFLQANRGDQILYEFICRRFDLWLDCLGERLMTAAANG